MAERTGPRPIVAAPTALAERRDGRLRPLFLVGMAVFLAVPISALLTTRPSPFHAGLAVLALGMIVSSLFPAVFQGRHGWGREGRVAAVVVIAIAAIAMVLSIDTRVGSWVALFYFAAIVASRIRPDRRALLLMTTAGAMAGVALALAGEDVGSAGIQGLSVTLVGCAVFGMATLQRTNAQLLAARDEIARLAIAEERARIARDLHDTLGHSLTVIALKSELAGRLLPAQADRARSEIADVERVAREALASVRETVSGYRRPTLDGELVEVQASLDAAGIAVTVQRDPQPLPPAVESVLAWAVREGTTNILRHSATQRASISVGRTGGSATASIEDAGPVRAATAAGEASPGGSGIAGLRERVAAQGGDVEAGPTPSGGYRLRVRVPLGEGAA